MRPLRPLTLADWRPVSVEELRAYLATGEWPKPPPKPPPPWRPSRQMAKLALTFMGEWDGARKSLAYACFGAYSAHFPPDPGADQQGRGP